MVFHFAIDGTLCNEDLEKLSNPAAVSSDDFHYIDWVSRFFAHVANFCLARRVWLIISWLFIYGAVLYCLVVLMVCVYVSLCCELGILVS